MVSTWTLILRSEVFADDVVFVRIEREREHRKQGLHAFHGESTERYQRAKSEETNQADIKLKSGQ